MGINQRGLVKMKGSEIAEFLEQHRTGSLATNSSTGMPHLVAMWYAMVDGQIWLEAKVKSQKIVNLKRDPRATFLIESGLTYDSLRGVSVEGRGVISDDPVEKSKVFANIYERYLGGPGESSSQQIEAMALNRVVVRIEVDRIRSWDHRKLGLDRETARGSTAQYIGSR